MTRTRPACSSAGAGGTGRLLESLRPCFGRRQAWLPAALRFRTKGQLAAGLCAGVCADGLAFGFAAGDEVYGASP